MNTRRLHVKRLREMRSAVRHARHTAQAARKHLARAVAVAHSGAVRVNRAFARLAYLEEGAALRASELDRLTIDPSPLREWQTELAENLAEFEAITEKALKAATRKAERPAPVRKRRRG